MSAPFQILVTALHLVSVNAAFGGPILAFLLFLRSRRSPDDAIGDVGRSLLRGSLFGFYAGMALGVVAALMWWSAEDRAVERAFLAIPRSRYYFTIAELVFSVVVFEAWSALWQKNAERKESRRTLLIVGLAVVGITNTVYHFPTLFAALSVLSTRMPAPDGSLRFVTLLIDPEVLVRVAHFALASLAVAGAMLAALTATKRHEGGDDSPSAAEALERLQRRGALITLIATLLQWPIGIFVVLQLPEISRQSLLGYDAGVTALFALSLGGVIMVMHRSAAAAFGPVSPAELRSMLLWLGITIMLMTAVRHYSREPAYDLTSVSPATISLASSHALFTEDSRT